MKQEKMGLTVRIAQRQDASTLAHFLSIIDDQPLTAVEILSRLDELRGVETPVLAFIGSQPAGFACLRIITSISTGLPSAELTELYVEKSFTGGEIERALIQRVENLATQREVSNLTLLTGLKNTTAQSIYRSLGFQDYALAMRKFLKAEG